MTANPSGNSVLTGKISGLEGTVTLGAKAGNLEAVELIKMVSFICRCVNNAGRMTLFLAYLCVVAFLLQKLHAIEGLAPRFPCEPLRENYIGPFSSTGRYDC